MLASTREGVAHIWRPVILNYHEKPKFQGTISSPFS
jgi:hypothetical protein